MLRLRLFRVLLPALLLVLGAVVVYNIKPPGSAHSLPQEIDETPTAEMLVFKEWAGDQPSVSGNVDLIQDAADGSLHLEGIQHLEILRSDGGTLVVSAKRGDRKGPEGERVWHFDDEVVFHDPQEDLTLTLPVLEVDQLAGEARSEGEIHFTAPEGRGQATALLYGLKGQPSHVSDPRIQDDVGGRLRADEATLWDGFDDVELIGNAHADQPGGQLDADRMRLKRGANGRLRHAVCQGDVRGDWGVALGEAQMAGDELEIHWDAEGEVQSVRLEGHARIHRGAESLAAPRIDLRRPASGGPGWELQAGDTVYIHGLTPSGPGLMEAERLVAWLNEAFEMQRAEVQGRVTFEGGGTRGQADRADFVAMGATGQVRLFGNERRKARLLQGGTRIAADEIVTDPRGTRMTATGRVDATVLPGTSGNVGLQNRMFEASEAVHFVSDILTSAQAGQVLTFSGSVRGWQGERNLAAETMTLDQLLHTLHASGRVSTRVPREQGSASVAESDFMLIESEELHYDDARGVAAYEDDVRLRFAEGWVNADRVEIWLGEESQRIHEVRAFGQVRLEITHTGSTELNGPTTGQADRLVYLPDGGTIRLFGDKAPAMLDRTVEGVSTSGRVLRYNLDLGTFEVDSGDQGPASIRTSRN